MGHYNGSFGTYDSHTYDSGTHTGRKIRRTSKRRNQRSINGLILVLLLATFAVCLILLNLASHSLVPLDGSTVGSMSANVAKTIPLKSHPYAVMLEVETASGLVLHKNCLVPTGKSLALKGEMLNPWGSLRPLGIYAGYRVTEIDGCYTNEKSLVQGGAAIIALPDQSGLSWLTDQNVLLLSFTPKSSSHISIIASPSGLEVQPGS